MKALRTLSLMLLLSQSNSFGMWPFSKKSAPEQTPQEEAARTWRERNQETLNTLLQSAIESSDVNLTIVRGLRRAGANINDELIKPHNEETGDTKLHIVLQENNLSKLKRILFCMHQTNIKNKKGQTPFMTAVAQKEKHGEDHKDIVIALIEHLNNDERIEAFEHAIEIKDTELMGLILDSGVDIPENIRGRISDQINIVYGGDNERLQEVYSILEGQGGLEKNIDDTLKLAGEVIVDIKDAFAHLGTKALVKINNWSHHIGKAFMAAETGELPDQDDDTQEDISNNSSEEQEEEFVSVTNNDTDTNKKEE